MVSINTGSWLYLAHRPICQWSQFSSLPPKPLVTFFSYSGHFWCFPGENCWGRKGYSPRLVRGLHTSSGKALGPVSRARWVGMQPSGRPAGWKVLSCSHCRNMKCEVQIREDPKFNDFFTADLKYPVLPSSWDSSQDCFPIISSH